ncbi:MAG: hypothetical protein AMS27_09455, partial [Bacteroides sp. SM23_62_1]
MLRNNFKYSLFIFIILFMHMDMLKGRNLDETGLVSVYYFSPQKYYAHPQNWDITQDKRGIMYFGNNSGVLEYDGVEWRMIKVSDGSTVKSLACDDNGKVYVGAQNEFGFLQSDSTGQLTYISLSEQLNDSIEYFDFIWSTHVIQEGVVFQAQEYVFIWKDDSLHVIHSEAPVHESFNVNGTIYLRLEGVGIVQLEKNRFVPVREGELFSNLFVYGMIPLSRSRVLIVTDYDGLYMMEVGESSGEVTDISRIRTKIEQLLEQVEIYNVNKIDDNRISLGTWGNGVIIIDTTWNLVTVIDKYAGLEDQIVQQQFVDSNGNLWLALSNGISRVEINSPITFFTDHNGLLGTVQSVTRFNNTIYVATLRGLFYLDKESLSDRLTGIKTPIFKVVEGMDEMECWNLITFKNEGEEILLVVMNTDVMQIDRNNNRDIVLEEVPWTLYQSKLDPARVFVGLERGLASIYRSNGKWINEGRIEGIDEEITQLSEDFIGNLWLGTPEINVIKVNILSFENNRIKDLSISRYDSTFGLPEGPFVFSQTVGPLNVATNKGIYKYVPHENRFVPDTTFGKQFADGSKWIHRMIRDEDSDIWMVVASEDGEKPYEVGYLRPLGNNRYEWIAGPFKKISENIIHAVFIDEEQVVWLGGSEGLFRYDQKIKKDYEIPYWAYIRSVNLSQGQKIFGGTNFNEAGLNILTQPGVLRPTLTFTNNSLVFNYAAQSGEDEAFLMFSYFLEGNDTKWSDWSNESKKEYTNLHEGKYIFRVKARNIYNHESNEATYDFTILAPWYRKWWAFILYVILATAIVYVIVKVYTRQLRQIIKERTAEVVRQKDEIEKQKEEIEEKNNDIMDSIKYAQKIQTALLPPEQDMSLLGLDGFILFLPRDIVSGDFYWIGQKNGKAITVAADCTGHGVPGAFMSMLGLSFLNNIIGEAEDVKANEILNELRGQVITHLRQKGEEGEQKDGMDLALHIIDKGKNRIEFAGANNPLILIRNDEIIQVKADRMPIGIHERADEPFQNNVMEV